MPRKELKDPQQVEQWLVTWGNALQEQDKAGALTLIGSAALLWHAHQNQIATPLPQNSMDADPVTTDESIAELGYEAGIGSEFEATHGWHINLMPEQVLSELPPDWKDHQSTKAYGPLTVHVPCVVHLLLPKIRRGEPRDIAHYQWARNVDLLNAKNPQALNLLNEALKRYEEKHKLHDPR